MWGVLKSVVAHLSTQFPNEQQNYPNEQQKYSNEQQKYPDEQQWQQPKKQFLGPLGQAFAVKNGPQEDFVFFFGKLTIPMWCLNKVGKFCEPFGSKIVRYQKQKKIHYLGTRRFCTYFWEVDHPLCMWCLNKVGKFCEHFNQKCMVPKTKNDPL